MKYRIVATSSDTTPYKVQRQNEKSFFPIWRKVAKSKTYHEAVRFAKNATERHSEHPAGKIVLEYDESDLVVERLKNQRNMDRAESSGANVAQAAMAFSPAALSPLVSKEHIMRLAGITKE